MPLGWPEVDPETKLEPVLEAWPELERLLHALSPSFRALEDPLLRRTFARAATLRQVALAAGVSVESLLELMASALRQPGAPVEAPSRLPPREAPEWTRRPPFARHDARQDVERGIHPLPGVMAELEKLPEGAVYELLTPLLPAPLLGLLAKRGYEAHAELDAARGFARTVIRRAPST